MENKEIIPQSALARGPDAIRGSGHAFIYTKYPDPDGNHWFLKPGYIGHETMTNSPEMLQALFGPEAKKVYEEVVDLRDVYANDAKGYPAPTGEKREEYDYHEIRRRAKQHNLFGRAGTLHNRNIVMLWGAPPDWQSMLVKVLDHLKSPPDTVITIGTKQFLASDFTDQQKAHEQSTAVSADQQANKDRLELQARYHTATGAMKYAIGRQLGLNTSRQTSSAKKWREQGLIAGAHGAPYIYTHGESLQMPSNIQVKIEEGTVTRADINTLIETSFKSAQERILRRTRTRDSNDGHDEEGHAGPARVGSRVAPRRGGGKLNDPRRTARGRRAVSTQEGKYAEATRFILENRGKPVDRKLPTVQDRAALKRLTARLLTVEQADRDWYYALYRRLEG